MSARLPILHNSLFSGRDFQFALFKPEIGVDDACGGLQPCPCPEPPAKRVVAAQATQYAAGAARDSTPVAMTSMPACFLSLRWLTSHKCHAKTGAAGIARYST